MDKQAEADKMVVIGCCSTGSASGGHRAGTPPLLEPALQQSIKTILFVSAYLSASAASLVQGRWIYHKSTGPIGECLVGLRQHPMVARGSRPGPGGNLPRVRHSTESPQKKGIWESRLEGDTSNCAMIHCRK